MKKFLLMTVVMLAVACLAIGTLNYGEVTFMRPELPAVVLRESEPTTLRATESGPVIGFNDQNNTHVWYGIPYAKPPVGKLRWKAPRQIESWSETFEALDHNSSCMQSSTPLSRTNWAPPDIVGSEDCLYLDIWAPRSAAEKAAQIEQQLPVLIWLHGEDSTFGSARLFNGDKFAGDQQVVFVSLNYRLGYFGSFAHRAIRGTSTTDEDASGNYALLDIVMALNWVKKNIANFGGDAGNVTIMGESQGGRNVMALIASPVAEGLFHKAIIQSGSLRSELLHHAENFIDDEKPGRSSSSSELIAKLFVDQGISSDRAEAIDDIRSMSDEAIRAFLEKQPAEKIILASYIHLLEGGSTNQIPQLIRDGNVIPIEPFSELLTDPIRYNNVPMIIGSNRDDATFLVMSDPQHTRWFLGIIPVFEDKKDYSMLADLLSNRTHLLAVEEPSRLMARSRIDVQAPPNIFTYRFDWDEIDSTWFIDFPNLIGASRSIELGFIFGDFSGALALTDLHNKGKAPEQLALSQTMMEYWGSFIHTGSPNNGTSLELPEWLPWSDSGENTLVFDGSKQGGSRMEARHLGTENFLTNLASKTELMTQQQRCDLLVKVFLVSDQSNDQWGESYHEDLPSQGCLGFNRSSRDNPPSIQKVPHSE